MQQWCLLPLGKIHTGEKVIIESLNLCKSLQSQLYNLGVLPGREISVLSGERGRPFMIQSQSSEIALDWDTVCAIQVKKGTLC